MNAPWYLVPVVVTLLAQPISNGVSNAGLADNTLSRAEKDAGWILLFDGKSLNGWHTSSRQPSKVPVENGCINPHGCGGSMMIDEKAWANFVLGMDFKISKRSTAGFLCGRIL